MEIGGANSYQRLDTQSQALEARLRHLREAAPAGGRDDASLRKVSRDLEAVFVKQLLDTMQQTAQSEDQTQAMDTWREMFNQKLAETVCERNSIGLSGMIYRQLSDDLEGHREVPPAGPAIPLPPLPPRPPPLPPTAPRAASRAPPRRFRPPPPRGNPPGGWPITWSRSSARPRPRGWTRPWWPRWCSRNRPGTRWRSARPAPAD